MDLVLARWRDAHFDLEEAALPADYIVETVGFLLAEGPVFVSVAAERLPEGEHRAITHIPLESLLDLVHLERPHLRGTPEETRQGYTE